MEKSRATRIGYTEGGGMMIKKNLIDKVTRE